MLFVTVGYGDEAGYQETDAEIRDAAHRHDDALKPLSLAVGIAGRPVQVRNPDDAGLQVREGSFMTAKLPVAGFSIIEAPSLTVAIDMVSKTPCAVAHGVVEVWPLETTPQ